MTVLKKIDVVSAMKVSAALNAVVGLIAGLFMGLMGGLITSMFPTGGTTPAGLLPMMGAFGIALIVIMPIVAAIGGAIWGLIASVLYNFIADMWGGLEVELK